MNNINFEKIKAAYDKEGFVVVKDFFSKQKLSEMDRWSMEVMDWPETQGKWFKYFEMSREIGSDKKVKKLSKVEDFVKYHEGFNYFVREPKFVELLTHLMGEPVSFFKEKLNVKLPGGKGYQAHQDAPGYFHIDYDAITAFIAIDPVPVDSRCLYFSDSVFTEMLPQKKGTGALATEVADSLNWFPVTCEPGDMILFSSYTPHYSLQNVGNHMRRALFLTYGKEEKTQGMTEKYYADKREAFPQDCEKVPGVDYTKAAGVYSYSSPAIVNQPIQE